MNPPVEERIAYNQYKFEKTMREANDELWVEFEGKNVQMIKPIQYKLSCVYEAAIYLNTEIYFRQIQLMEKYT